MSTNLDRLLTPEEARAYIEARKAEQAEAIKEDEFFQEPSDDDIETISESEAYERYDNMLDDCYPMVDVCGYTYDPSRALKELDPIAYRVGFSDYVSSLEEDNIQVEGY
jgi:hypothetical protein